MRYHKTKSNLELDKADLRMKISGLQHEVEAERRRVAAAEAILRRIRTDLHETVQHIQDPKALKVRCAMHHSSHSNYYVGKCSPVVSETCECQNQGTWT